MSEQEKYCGYMCAGEIDKLKELLKTLEIFSNDNPEWALKVVRDMDSLMSETKTKIINKNNNIT